ncbi:MAG: hypothetical protein HY000_08025 [Planctomycetes bacterium]|nr:hypothetical protein [Planctomycetota bacterium]
MKSLASLGRVDAPVAVAISSDPEPCVAEAADHESLPSADERSILGLVELLLKHPSRVDTLVREESRQAELIPRFLAIGLAGFIIFGLAATAILNMSGTWAPWVPKARWFDATAANLVLAYNVGIIAAIGVCLPSFYFYGLLAGVKASMLQVTTHALKGLAASAVALVGILPAYTAVALGMIVLRASEPWMHATIYLGLALPFIAGLWGVRSLYVGFVGLADTMPPAFRCRRECFLRRLILAWSGCYTAVTPVMIYSLWHYFSV